MARLNLAIIGVGLIGGSLGLCLKDKMGDDIYITGQCRTQESMDKAMEMGAVDFASSDIEEVVRDSDVIFLSTPVLQMVPMVEKMLPYLKSGAIITDAGSTKQFIWKNLQKILPPDIYYVAGHPMTGREMSGVTAAKKDLFENKCYVIVENTGAPKEATDKICELVRLTGADLETLDIAQHDRCASVISHIPHVAAAGLVTLLNRSHGDMEACLKLAGGGFKDTTRIASSNADMWADICMTNQEAITNHLKLLQGILAEVIVAIESGDRQAVHDYFAESKKRRDSILEQTKNMYELI
ncbi:prephenate dehydrogenase [Anaerovibrio lipolyticus DSM 3074]|uniref:Arogenate dehydrogenase n=2 Tax=Anaerovibrio lipolyticus TaxID=82374 RepID=A0A0B2JL62_9FIRM|nr:prephenate dehydrogenase/arogenate dehydrogenase family protein [Anaerovibrio lipolyticus]KHM47473.1 arogenate dehydrogenase [Anaerovibrio lipolyticus]SHI79628.1 prephenate dehydrogenase [Anaerovibrio lipolyticus DSM 3074]